MLWACRLFPLFSPIKTHQLILFNIYTDTSCKCCRFEAENAPVLSSQVLFPLRYVALWCQGGDTRSVLITGVVRNSTRQPRVRLRYLWLAFWDSLLPPLLCPGETIVLKEATSCHLVNVPVMFMTFEVPVKPAANLTFLPFSPLPPTPELHRPDRRQRGRGQRHGRWERAQGRGLRDPPHHPTQPPRAPSASPDGARLHELPLPLAATQRAHQPVLVPGAAHAHDVQHAGTGEPPRLQPDALGEWTSSRNTYVTSTARNGVRPPKVDTHFKRKQPVIVYLLPCQLWRMLRGIVGKSISVIPTSTARIGQAVKASDMNTALFIPPLPEHSVATLLLMMRAKV